MKQNTTRTVRSYIYSALLQCSTSFISYVSHWNDGASSWLLPRRYSCTLLKINESCFDESLLNNSTELKNVLKLKFIKNVLKLKFIRAFEEKSASIS